jgi:hypothetical protein
MVLARERQAAGRRPHGTGARKQAVSRGTAKMKEAADLAMEALSDEIATSLLDRTVGGNATIAKVLFALAEGQIDCERRRPALENVNWRLDQANRFLFPAGDR